MKTSVALLLINTVALFQSSELSSQSSQDPGTSSSGRKNSRASSSESTNSRASSSGTNHSSLNYIKGLYIPNGKEIWLKDKIIAKEEDGVYRPFLHLTEFAILRALHNRKKPFDIGFKVVRVTQQEWLNYIAEYASKQKRPSILYSGRSTVMELTKAKRQAVEELIMERQRVAAFDELYKFDKQKGWQQ
ncbi:uncharacterized protein LOC117173936 [Belonocnema kinseyi]|uniref:uncharacterized protein LOC117173936 n=1 Tax=Belonocnema kinseyi TaxID=2817044 RepID=UPI00143D7355|nr:uncharacterized protein LOC117173936 [Belonocnema kinseyi]